MINCVICCFIMDLEVVFIMSYLVIYFLVVFNYESIYLVFVVDYEYVCV